ALLALSVLAFVSFGQYFEITNDTGFDVYFVYISYSSEDDWGGDWLGEDIMYDGETFEFDISDLAWETDLFDIQLEDEDGDTYTFLAVDGEEYGSGVGDNVFTVTLSDLD
ncbi:MAG: hypothetical protein KAH54_11240, partial [Candidatus Sabulitectum sp.]|nr:hypothetical protein [Candidatus Sabulitectum sp.]